MCDVQIDCTDDLGQFEDSEEKSEEEIDMTMHFMRNLNERNAMMNAIDDDSDDTSSSETPLAEIARRQKTAAKLIELQRILNKRVDKQEMDISADELKAVIDSVLRPKEHLENSSDESLDESSDGMIAAVTAGRHCLLNSLEYN